MKKRKLNLKELELQIPAIEKEETRVILGGNGYTDIPEVVITKERDDDPDRYDPWNRDDWDMRGDQDDQDHYPDSPDRDGDSNRDHNGDGDPHDNLKIDTGNPKFDKMVKDHLDNNQQLKEQIEKLLKDGTNKISFAIDDLGKAVPGQEYKVAETKSDASHSSYTITFNSNSFDSEGNYIYDSYGRSNDGTDTTKLTSDQELVEYLAHELLHIVYSERIDEVYGQHINDGEEAMSNIANELEEKYGEDFRNAFMEYRDGTWEWRSQESDEFDKFIHDYMRENGLDFIEKAIEEYNNSKK